MRNLSITAMFLLVIVGTLTAQAPKGINYQGVARDQQGKPLVSKNISLRISILEDAASGNSIFDEIHEIQTNQFGLFSLVIGTNREGFNSINWSSGNKWLQIELDENGGRNFQLMGSQELMSVPYALFAERSGNGYQAGQGIEIANNTISNVGDGDTDSSNELISSIILDTGAKLKITDSGGTKEVDLSSLTSSAQDLTSVLVNGNDAGTLTIKNLGTPTVANEAATKAYVDIHTDPDSDASNEIQNLNEVLLQGNNANGSKITNLGAPTTNSDATTKLYVDNLDAVDLDKSPTNEIQSLTDVLTQSNDANGLKVTNLGTPTGNSEATTKLYVDQADILLGNRISTNYAFQVSYDHTHSSPTTEVVTINAEEFDDFNVMSGNTFITPESGAYHFTVTGTSPIGGIPMQIRVTRLSGPVELIEVKRQIGFPSASIPNYYDSRLIKLDPGDTIELIVTSAITNEVVTGIFFGFKL